MYVSGSSWSAITVKIATFAAGISLLVPASAALGETFKQMGFGSVLVVMSGSTVYTTGWDGPGTSNSIITYTPGTKYGYSILLSEFYFTAPLGSLITSADLKLTPLTPDAGSAEAATTSAGFEPLPRPNPSDPKSFAPTFYSGGKVHIGDVLELNGVTGVNGVFDLPVATDGSNTYVSNALEFVISDASFTSYIATQGYNWAGYVDVFGTATIQYSGELDVTYTSATPEPSSLILLVTGLVTLTGILLLQRQSSMAS